MESPYSLWCRSNYGSIVYLNDDYGGGELLFEDGQKFKLEKNSCIFFKGDIKNRHEVLEITEGKRYTLPAWYTKWYFKI